MSRSKAEDPRILCVDDDPSIQAGLRVVLRKMATVVTVDSAKAALAALESQPPFTVIISDMRMPEMDGASLLVEVRRRWPDVVRVMLTGFAEIEAATRAINEGQIYRFLVKPCPPEELRSVVAAAIRQHELVTAERVLLTDTLRGTVNMMSELLAVANPLVFGRVERIKRLVRASGRMANLDDLWALDISATCSQLGYVMLSPELAEKVYFLRELTSSEAERVASIPAFVDGLIKKIPRLQKVRAIVDAHWKAGYAGWKQNAVPMGAHFLRLALDFDILEQESEDPLTAIMAIEAQRETYPEQPLGVFSTYVRGRDQGKLRTIAPGQLEAGMVLAQDITTKHGRLLMSRGHVLTEELIVRLRELASGSLPTAIKVYDPGTARTFDGTRAP